MEYLKISRNLEFVKKLAQYVNDVQAANPHPVMDYYKSKSSENVFLKHIVKMLKAYGEKNPSWAIGKRYPENDSQLFQVKNWLTSGDARTLMPVLIKETETKLLTVQKQYLDYTPIEQMPVAAIKEAFETRMPDLAELFKKHFGL